MSHNPTYRTCNFEADIRKVEAQIAEMVAHECYQEGGHLIPIKWNNKKVFDSYDEAKEYLESTDNGWYDNRAVIFLDYSDAFKPSKRYDELQRRISEWRTKYNNLLSENHFKEAKSKLITCKACESKVNKDYIRYNNCPVCRASMLPPTTVNQIDRAKEMIAQLSKQLEEERKRLEGKLKSKAKKKWLIYYDYHT